MNFEKINVAAKGYLPQMTKFLRELIAIPGESCGDEILIKRIEREMKDVGFDKVEIDPMGNILGYMGNGEKIIAFDAHIDTVGIGEILNWKFDPYEGYETETEIGGRAMTAYALYLNAYFHTSSLSTVDTAVCRLCGNNKFRTNLVFVDNVLPAETVTVFFLYSTCHKYLIFIV